MLLLDGCDDATSPLGEDEEKLKVAEEENRRRYKER